MGKTWKPSVAECNCVSVLETVVTTLFLRTLGSNEAFCSNRSGFRRSVTISTSPFLKRIMIKRELFGKWLDQQTVI